VNSLCARERLQVLLGILGAQQRVELAGDAVGVIE
jgi:hypothetical protein